MSFSPVLAAIVTTLMTVNVLIIALDLIPRY